MRTDYWRAAWMRYRKKTGKLTWRVATPADMPAIQKLRLRSARFLRAEQNNPDLFSIPVLLALVAEDARGRIVDALYAEAQVELIKLGCSAVGFEESAELEADLASWLRALGYRTVLATSPPQLAEKMAATFCKLGMTSVSSAFRYWKRKL